MDINVEGATYQLQRSQVHGSIWGLYPKGIKPRKHTVEEITEATVPILPESRDTPVALIGIFVDDFLFSGPAQFLRALHQALSERVKIGAPDILGKRAPVYRSWACS